MSIHALYNLLNTAGMHAVFTTLIHSLWIGALMALLAGIIITLTKKYKPQLRYQLLTGLLGLFILCMLLVFYTAFTNETREAATDSNKTMVVAVASTTIHASTIQQQQQNVFGTIISFLQANAGIIVSIWMMVIIFKCLLLMSGLSSLRSMKKRWIMEAGDHWNERLRELAAKLEIKRPVVFLQSSLAKVPMVIGHLKPFVLLPMGILNSLPPDEVEAILLHELAHIKRSDFLVNLLQQFAEIFFFFNPAVLWISSLIKNERENCCD
ncbi:MAG: M56 family metallopeptidase, partial [Ginsengibacter sp.]